MIVKDTNAIHALKQSQGQNIKITVTRFQVKESCLMTDDCLSSGEVDDEVYNGTDNYCWLCLLDIYFF